MISARLAAAAVMVVVIMMATSAVAAADPRLDDLCRNPAFRNMHEHECIVNGNHGPAYSNSDDGGLLGIIGRVLGGIL